ncbi:MAG: DUF2293 domain-containing protein [Planctomycetota bacterium JB042]
MPDRTRSVTPGARPRTVTLPSGDPLPVPAGWELLPPGDSALTRRVKAGGPAWTMTEKRGRRTFTLGVWAPTERIERIRADLAEERADPAYARRLEAGRKRRAEEQEAYAGAFEAEVRAFLGFAPPHGALGDELARAIATHATPVGSGTVARTKRIPVEERAAAATIAWLRHRTTTYDSMRIPREKGARREVRRMLAARSRELLDRYRRGEPVDPGACPLRRGLDAASP